MVEAGHKPRRAPTEREILDAALGLLDTGGRPAASIRRIAAAVGVAPTTVYTFFPDRTAVECALIERLLGAVRIGGGGSWREAVEAIALDLRQRLVAHPGVVPLLLSGPLDGPHAQRIADCLLELLGASGLDPRSAARASYALMVFVLGAIALETFDAPRAMIGRAGPDRYLWGLRRMLDGVEAEAKLH
ncbi:TetR/AcrR family transcriptional regulator [Actinoplanes sp. NPDC051513]|uniref:TetR/AcrR family transcriptional regulator n=1 Tax=Actinoplanes sp. NPDC051513 TaxID=3363908 RepID=UPI0037B12097